MEHCLEWIKDDEEDAVRDNRNSALFSVPATAALSRLVLATYARDSLLEDQQQPRSIPVHHRLNSKGRSGQYCSLKEGRWSSARLSGRDLSRGPWLSNDL